MPSHKKTVAASDLVLRAKQLEIEAARHLADRVELVDAIGHLIDALQRERGTSSVFVASGGERFRDARLSTIAEARQQEQRLRVLFEGQMSAAAGATAKMLSLMAWVALGLDALDGLRQQIGGLSLSAHDAVAAYSRLIAGLVELIFLVADASLLPGVTGLLVAFLHLVQSTETAGQERAVGAQLFASGVNNEGQQQRIAQLIAAQERSLQVFADFVDPVLRVRWEQQQLSPAVAKLERMRRILCIGKPGAPLDRNASDEWFSVCSDRMVELWRFQIELLHGLREACATQIRMAQQDLLDSEGLLRVLRNNTPPHTHAVERFFDVAFQPDVAPEMPHAPESTSLLDLLQTQATRLANVEAELDVARKTLNDRKVVERAKGALMSRLHLTEEEAFRALQKTSMDQNRRLLDVAEATLSLPDLAFAQIGAQSVQVRTKKR